MFEKGLNLIEMLTRNMLNEIIQLKSLLIIREDNQQIQLIKMRDEMLAEIREMKSLINENIKTIRED